MAISIHASAIPFGYDIDKLSSALHFFFAMITKYEYSYHLYLISLILV